MLPTGLKMPVRQNNSGPVSQPGGAACFGKEHRKQLRIYLLRPLQFFHRMCTINPNTWVERDRYEEEKNRESDHGPYIAAIVIAGVSAALMTRTAMGERLAILNVIRQKQYRLILPPVCDKMGKKRKRVEENAV